MVDRVFINGGFTAIPNEILRNPDLSLDAKGMLALVASHAGDWEFRRSDMMRKANVKKDKYYRIINELKDNGYLFISPRDSANGRFCGSDWTLNFAPCPSKPDAVPCPSKPDVIGPSKPDAIGPSKPDNKKNKRIKKETLGGVPEFRRLPRSDDEKKRADELVSSFRARVGSGGKSFG